MIIVFIYSKILKEKVNRFPDVDFFRQNDVQQRLTDILFIYCKLNREVSYRQGMHELLAPFYWIIALESLDTANIDYDPTE
ncbi:MAG: hypothetical protein JSY10_25575 [Paenibacillus sp.]|nr:hypothetical protein [Paenibacillus sp.]